jgi:uncharacterized protein (TIGR00369 family)
MEQAPIIKTYGARLSYDEQGGAVWDLPYNAKFDHAMGGVHGSVLGMLLDNAGWFTVAPYYDTWIATVEYQVRLLEHIERQDLRAVGSVVRLGTRLATASMEVKSAGDDKLVAVGSGTFSVSSVPLELS